MMKKYRNRYGAEYSYEHIEGKTYKFVMSEEDLKWCRWSNREDGEGLGMFDPSGGPFVAVGSRCQVGVVNKILYKDNNVFIEVE